MSADESDLPPRQVLVMTTLEITTTTSDLGQFSPNDTTTAEDKARLAASLVAFLLGGCQEAGFTEELHELVTATFGHRKHFDRAGFFEVWFSEPACRAAYVEQAIAWAWEDDNRLTPGWADVELALQQEFRRLELFERFRSEAYAAYVASEQSDLERLIIRYGPRPMRTAPSGRVIDFDARDLAALAAVGERTARSKRLADSTRAVQTIVDAIIVG